MIRIATLTTCHNRSDLTERSLKSLLAQEIDLDIEISNYIVDDGSTDNTVALVKGVDENVVIINGDGNLYWAGGMRFGWEEIKDESNADYFLFYNDDVELTKNAFGELLHVLTSDGSIGAAVANIASRSSNNPTYGLREILWPYFPIKYKLVAPKADGISYAQTFNMNAVMIPMEVLRTQGFLSPNYIHSQADYEFGYRLRKSGFKIASPPGVQGYGERNSEINTSRDPRLGLINKFRLFNGLKESPIRQNLDFHIDMYGSRGFVFFVFPYVKLFFIHIYQTFKRT